MDGQSNAFVAGVTPGVNRQTFPVSTVIGPTTTNTGVLVARLSPNPTRRVYLPALLVR